MGEYCAQMRVAGQIYVGTFAGGIGRKWLGPGSTVRNCSIIWPQYLTNVATDLGMATPSVRVIGANAKWGIGDSVIGASSISVETNEVTAPTPVTDNNYLIASQDSTAVFNSPNTGLASAQYLEDVIDALTPKAGGPATVAGGAARVRGAVGTGRLDHLQRTYDTTLFDPLAGQPTSQAHWTAAAPAGTPSVGSTLTAPNYSWNDSVTTISQVWLKNGVQQGSTNSSTFVVPAGYSGAVVQHGIRVTDSQGNVVVAVSTGVTIA
jgi:hypothetical protein